MDELQNRLFQALAQIEAAYQFGQQGTQRVAQGLQTNPSAFLFPEQYGNLIRQAPYVPGLTQAAQIANKLLYQPMGQTAQQNRALWQKDPRLMTPEEQTQMAMAGMQIMGSLQAVSPPIMPQVTKPIGGGPSIEDLKKSGFLVDRSPQAGPANGPVMQGIQARQTAAGMGFLADFENAYNAGDWGAAQKAIDTIPEGNSYKITLQTMLNNRLAQIKPL